ALVAGRRIWPKYVPGLMRMTVRSELSSATVAIASWIVLKSSGTVIVRAPLAERFPDDGAIAAATVAPADSEGVGAPIARVVGGLYGLRYFASSGSARRSSSATIGPNSSLPAVLK